MTKRLITSTLTLIMDIDATTFNKNYTDINVSNYTRTVTPYPFKIKRSVFTCRNLPFNSTAWPQTDNILSVNTVSADLRYVTGTLSALPAPYLGQNGFSITTLKNPYSSQSSQTAIRLNNIGVTDMTGSFGITIGTITVSDFNLFDAHNKFIHATDANVNSFCNVFQNTRVTGGNAGAGIYTSNTYTNTSIISNKLNLVSTTSPSINFNRFYDCHTGIYSNNTSTLDVQYAQFKSTLSNTTTVSLTTSGLYGIYAIGNRYSSYDIKNCSFYNLNTAVYAGASPGFISVFAHGQVWGTFNIENNIFSPSTSTASGTSYLSNAILLENVLMSRGTTAAVNILTVSPMNGIRIRYNTMTDVYRGIEVRNMGNSIFYKTAAENNILLKADHSGLVDQWGVNFQNTYFGIVNSNTITGFSTTGSFPLKGIYITKVTTGAARCNSLSTLSKDFEFYGANTIIWGNNTMVSGGRGFQLTANGAIGNQGSYASPMDNYWTNPGTNWSGGNVQSFVLTSNPNLSVLTIRSLNGYTMTNNSGFPTYNSGSKVLGNNSASYFNCVALTSPTKGPNGIKTPFTKSIISNTLTYPGSYPNETKEINRFLVFRDLEEDTALLNSDPLIQSFYSNELSSLTASLVEVEDLLFTNALSSANSLLSSITESTGIQTNHKTFYTLYKKFADPGIGLNNTDKTNLNTLAHKCPAIDGTIIYQARNLNNIVRGMVETYSDEGCDGSSSLVYEGEEEMRKANMSSENKHGIDYTLFPNPASDQLNIFSPVEKESLLIEIRDVTNKLIFEDVLAIENHSAFIKLNLLSGVYFVSLIESDNKTTIQKLVISK